MRIIGNDPSTPRQAQIVASGTLSTGDAVVVNSDGTVSVVAGSAEVIGTDVVFESAASLFISADYDTANNKVVVAYEDDANSDYGTAVVGTVSGTSISFGSPVVFSSSNTRETSVAFDSASSKIVVAYKDSGNSGYGEAVVGTVSGTSISFGTAVVFESAVVNYISAAYDVNAEKVVVAYEDSGNSGYGTAIVGTVSGTSISFGSPAVFNSGGGTNEISAVYDSNTQKIVVAYRDVGNSSFGTAVVATVSGTSVTFGSETVFESAVTTNISTTFDGSSNKVVIAYKDEGNSNYGTAIVGTVSGTSISFGSPVVFESANSIEISASYDSNANKIVVAYTDVDNSLYGTLAVGSVSGTSISFDSATVFSSGSTRDSFTTFDSDTNKVVIAYRDGSNSNYGTAVVYQAPSTNLTAENYIGTAATGAPDGKGAKINLKGAVDENQSGLTAGQSYYVQTDGTLGTTPADPSVFAGTAVAANKLIVKG